MVASPSPSSKHKLRSPSSPEPSSRLLAPTISSAQKKTPVAHKSRQHAAGSPSPSSRLLQPTVSSANRVKTPSPVKNRPSTSTSRSPAPLPRVAQMGSPSRGGAKKMPMRTTASTSAGANNKGGTTHSSSSLPRVAN